MFPQKQSYVLKALIWASMGSCLFSQVGWGQKTKKPVQKPGASTSSSVPSHLTSEFDASILNFNVSKGFRGHDFGEIYRKLTGIWSEKSEFESTQEYERRIRQMETRTLFGTVQINSKLAFVVPTKLQLAISSSSARYDADRRSLAVEISSDYGSLITDRTIVGSNRAGELNAFGISNEGPKLLRTYVGETGLGVKRKVTVGEYKRQSVVFANCTSSTTGRDYSSRMSTKSGTLSLPLSPTEAIDLKYNLGIIIIGHLVPPYSSYKRNLWTSAKVNSPIEVWIDEQVVFVDITELWLYSKSSGRVYAKVPEGSLRPVDRDSPYLSYNFLF